MPYLRCCAACLVAFVTENKAPNSTPPAGRSSMHGVFRVSRGIEMSAVETVSLTVTRDLLAREKGPGQRKSCPPTGPDADHDGFPDAYVVGSCSCVPAWGRCFPKRVCDSLLLSARYYLIASVPSSALKGTPHHPSPPLFHFAAVTIVFTPRTPCSETSTRTTSAMYVSG